jgi:redox-sensitive bicupin YhaK (pirin superfamily)
MTASIELLKPHVRDLGGFAVRRLLPALTHRTIGPFIFFDHMGPVAFAPGEGADVRPHPHIGLATVTYLFEGAMLHRDSLGNVQRIAPGDVNWMTAGRGIVHSERTPSAERAAGGRVHGLQTWVALPQADEETEPSFTHVDAADLPIREAAGVRCCVIAGRAFDLRAPTPTFSDTLYVAVTLASGSTLIVPAEHEQRAVYAVDGDIAIDGEAIPVAHMAVLPPDANVRVASRTGGRTMLVGGAALDGERHIWWNFVASTRERIEAAKAAWREQRFGTVPGETEFIPLPEAPTTPPQPPAFS